VKLAASKLGSCQIYLPVAIRVSVEEEEVEADVAHQRVPHRVRDILTWDLHGIVAIGQHAIDAAAPEGARGAA
jgi:hypothetical protein